MFYGYSKTLQGPSGQLIKPTTISKTIFKKEKRRGREDKNVFKSCEHI